MSELLSVSGRFWRAVPEDRVAQVLDPPGPESAGRYHRSGEPALYITREADWATIALGRYMAVDGVPRLAIPLELDSAKLLDQRDTGACAALASIQHDHKRAGRTFLRREANRHRGTPTR